MNKIKVYKKDLDNAMLAINRARQGDFSLLETIEWKDVSCYLTSIYRYSKEKIRAIMCVLYKQKCIDVFCLSNKKDLSETYIKQVTWGENNSFVKIPRYMGEFEYITVTL